MELAQLLDTLESAMKTWKIKAWSDGLSPSDNASKKADRVQLLAAARGLVPVLEVPQNRMLEISKAVYYTFHDLL